MSANRKTSIGIVVSHKMEKTAVVAVESLTLNAQYKKYIRTFKKFKVHDEKNDSKVGDKVEIVQTRPISKHKSWAIKKIVARDEKASIGTV